MRQFLLLFLASGCCQLSSAGFLKSRKTTLEGGLGNKCTYDDDCITKNAYCRNNAVCQCKTGFEYDDQSDACFPTRLGLSCYDDYDCSEFGNSNCQDRICKCRTGYVSQNDANCLQTSRLMASCADDSQCIAADQYSHCNMTSQLCSCNTNYHEAYDSHQCVPNKRVREICDSHSACANAPDQNDKVECRRDSDGRSKCFCRTGFEENTGISICARGLNGATGMQVVSVMCLFAAAMFAIFK